MVCMLYIIAKNGSTEIGSIVNIRPSTPAEVCATASNHAYKFLADSLGLPPSNVPNNN